MPKALDQRKRDAILDDIRAGRDSRSTIAKRHGVAGSTVTKLAKDNGLAGAFDRSHTKAATEALVADAAGRRALLADENLAVAVEALAALRDLLTADPMGAKNLAIAYGIVVDKHIALDRHDTDDGAGEAVSMLARLEAQLAAAHTAETPTGEEGTAA